MDVLIVGSGAREHAIGEKIKSNPNVDKLYFAPGNGGTMEIGENVDISPTDIDSLLNFAKDHNVDFTIVGPEDPLNLGIVDKFEDKGFKIFGPRKESAILEGSKAYAKEFMIKHKIPTAEYGNFTNYDDAYDFTLKLLDKNDKAVLKADGLKAGKGVFIVNNKDEAKASLEEIFNGNLNDSKVVVEEFLNGFEMSLIAFVDNNTIKVLPSSKDHKNIYENDAGPNTGGMGTYSPNFQADIYNDIIENDVLKPFMKGLKKDGLDFRGMIFIGLMIDGKDVKVLEFNTRFGDPETQSILNRLDSDLLDIMIKTSENKLSECDLDINDKKVVTLVLASSGYPSNYDKGFEITGVDKVKDVKIYHAGTKLENDKLVTNGGRVLSIVSIEDSFKDAYKKVYEAAKEIDFKGKYYRRDIGPMINRYYVEKKSGYDDYAERLNGYIVECLGFNPGDVRVFTRFDIEGLDDNEAEYVKNNILADENYEIIFQDEEAFNLEKDLKNPLVVEFQNGQFNEKEYATKKNLNLYTKREDINVKTAKVYSFDKNLSASEEKQIEDFIINKTNQTKGKLFGIPNTLRDLEEKSDKNEIYEGFIKLDEKELEEFRKERDLAMSFEDLKFIQDYFIKEGRDINETELYILDIYWSDHCRHTTFNTILDVKIEDPITELDKSIKREFDEYLKMRDSLNRKKPVSLMDLGTIVAKYLKKEGILTNVEESDEVNACSIEVDIDLEDRITKKPFTEKYLLMFKNETHNHPTEIEPYGGAHTCIGGGIRDPLSGRAYVYQAMRITGAGNPNISYEDTREGKLPQRRIAYEASEGYSTYGNEIGLAAGFLDEIYHDGFEAKRMELGALVGAQKKENVTRQNSEPGDVILLLGAKTGRDGIGAATGSSKEQVAKDISVPSPEVQRGNPPLERNIIRLFRRAEATKLIKKSNDFGAGGVSVAIGELADSLDIYLDRVPLKYNGLIPREIATAESQERMAVVIDKDNLDEFYKYCLEEDIETTHVADVTDSGKMIMYYDDKIVAEIHREFLDSAGASRYQKVLLNSNESTEYFSHKGRNIEDYYKNLDNLNYASKKNLYSKFDFTIGRGTVLAPLGGENFETPIQTMVALVPSLDANSKTASLMAYGYDPYLSSDNQFLGGYYAVLDSLSKIAAAGGNALKTNLSFQEFFESLGEDEEKWAKPMRSLLGAFYATRSLGVAPIGGKDSMSGTFQDISVPPTLFSFAVTTENIENIISPELKGGLKLGIVETKLNDDFTLDIEDYKENLEKIYEDIKSKNIKSAYALTYKGLLHDLMEMSVGNNIGFNIDFNRPLDVIPGSFIVEYEESRDFIDVIGLSGGVDRIINGETIDFEIFDEKYRESLDHIYTPIEEFETNIANSKAKLEFKYKSKKIDNIKAVIPVFPGTTGEYDIEELLLENEIEVEKVVFKVETVEDSKESIDALSKSIDDSNILILASGMVNGDEPDASGKYIETVLREEKIKNSIHKLLENEGLILGIGSGFSALIRTGLIENGKITDEKSSISISQNINEVFVSSLANVEYKTNNSPWLRNIELEKDYLTPLATKYGRIIMDNQTYNKLSENGQIVSVFKENYTGSEYAIESLMSSDGRILGKLTNFERVKENTLINVPKTQLQDLIGSLKDYFKK